MPQSRARKAICSAPFECPSRPGFPIRNFSLRPSLSDTRSTDERISSSPSVLFDFAFERPVGPRYSPCTDLIISAHSPVVTPAFAAVTEAGIILSPFFAALLRSLRAIFTFSASLSLRQVFSLSICSFSTAGSTIIIPLSPVVRGDSSLVVNLFTPTTTVSFVSILLSRSAFESTSRDFMYSIASIAPPILSRFANS